MANERRNSGPFAAKNAPFREFSNDTRGQSTRFVQTGFEPAPIVGDESGDGDADFHVEAKSLVAIGVFACLRNRGEPARKFHPADTPTRDRHRDAAV